MNIVVTTTIQTVFEVPEGVEIDRIKHLAIPMLTDGDDQTDEVLCLHNDAITSVFYGEESITSHVIEHKVVEIA